ncbi:MAG: hypothetical protein WD711_05005 [Dongiaceae bacterium]
MAIDPGYCHGGGESVLDARLAFGRSAAEAVLGFAAYDRLLEENKGAVEIIRAICTVETDETLRQRCAADALTDRIAAVEQRILAYLKERLQPAEAPADGFMLLPDGSRFAPFLAALQSDTPQPVFGSPRLEPDTQLGEIAAQTRTIATGIMLAENGAGSVFRILWQHGIVGWTSSAAWQFDPALLSFGHLNRTPSFDQPDVDAAQQDCLAAMRHAIETALPVTIHGPFAANGNAYYMRVSFTDVAGFECVAAPGSGVPAAIAATSQRE